MGEQFLKIGAEWKGLMEMAQKDHTQVIGQLEEEQRDQEGAGENKALFEGGSPGSLPREKVDRLAKEEHKEAVQKAVVDGEGNSGRDAGQDDPSEVGGCVHLLSTLIVKQERNEREEQGWYVSQPGHGVGVVVAREGEQEGGQERDAGREHGSRQEEQSQDGKGAEQGGDDVGGVDLRTDQCHADPGQEGEGRTAPDRRLPLDTLADLFGFLFKTIEVAARPHLLQLALEGICQAGGRRIDPAALQGINPLIKEWRAPLIDPLEAKEGAYNQDAEQQEGESPSAFAPGGSRPALGRGLTVLRRSHGTPGLTCQKEDSYNPCVSAILGASREAPGGFGTITGRDDEFR